jgi:AraC-like DNA-binding protein
MVLTSVYLNIIISLLIWVFQWRQNKAIIYLVSLILLANMRHIMVLLLNQPIESRILAVLLVHFDPVVILIGPLLFLYFKSLIQGKLVIEKWFWLYLIPFSLFLVNTFPFYLLDFESKVQFAKLMQHNNHAAINLPGGTKFFNYDIQMIIAPLHNWIFVGYTFFYLYQQKKKNLIKSKVSRIIVLVKCVILLMMTPVLLHILFATLKSPHSFDLSFQDSTISYDIMYLSTLLLPLSFFAFPTWLYGQQSSRSMIEKLKEIWKTGACEPADGLAVKTEKSADLDRIIQHIETKKPYLSPTFSLHTLSKELNIPHLYVSSCFNKEMNISFPEYRKRKRVEYAIALFREGAHKKMSIEGISTQSGFKNKSSFFLAFQTEFKMTPSEWISKHLG